MQELGHILTTSIPILVTGLNGAVYTSCARTRNARAAGHALLGAAVVMSVHLGKANAPSGGAWYNDRHLATLAAVAVLVLLLGLLYRHLEDTYTVTLEEVVEDLKLELDGYRSAARELAVEIEAKDRALEASAREMAHELSEGRAEAIREATSRLADRLEKAEKAVERERGDADRGRKACEKLRLLEAELERRMVDMDSDFEEKWAQRVKEANANAEAFKNKLARLEQEMMDVKMSEENARDELKRAKTEIEALTRRVEEVATRVPRHDDGENSDARTASKPRRGFFSFITGVPSEEYAGPKRPALETE